MPAVRQSVSGFWCIGRTVVALAVENWMFDWFAEFGTEAEDLEPDELDAEHEV